MICFTLLTKILNCTIGINCRPGAFIYHNWEDTKISRIYGEDMQNIAAQLKKQAPLQAQDISMDKTISADMHCVWKIDAQRVMPLIDDLLNAAEKNRQKNIQEIYNMLESYKVKPNNSSKKWLLQRRAFKALRGKYDCVSLLSRASTEGPLFKTNFPTGFSTISSEEDFVIKSYSANFAMITLIGISDLKILNKKVYSAIAYPPETSISTLKLVTSIFSDYQTDLMLANITPKAHSKLNFLFKFLSRLPFTVGGEDHRLIGLLTDVVLSWLKDLWEF
ncbi:hypothetical protein Golomagni_06318 [Golovinomyces magnicellulatus]|nr:hypothetical protein Golomagni_06318 [Golovinomyces magnicellulatus]